MMHSEHVANNVVYLLTWKTFINQGRPYTNFGPPRSRKNNKTSLYIFPHPFNCFPSKESLPHKHIHNLLPIKLDNRNQFCFHPNKFNVEWVQDQVRLQYCWNDSCLFYLLHLPFSCNECSGERRRRINKFLKCDVIMVMYKSFLLVLPWFDLSLSLFLSLFLYFFSFFLERIGSNDFITFLLLSFPSHIHSTCFV